METGRFQPPIENKCESSAFEERFGRRPGGAEGLSGSFVRAAYGATGVNQNPGDHSRISKTIIRTEAFYEHYRRLRQKTDHPGIRSR
ncbi:hypothetical protein [Desulfitobacterium chlororespirans]|uniref:hypothetical protein n=1 Tax=Desulfitobacterium chlororespirans TaxID=51616 RepID=UPI0015B39A2C